MNYNLQNLGEKIRLDAQTEKGENIVLTFTPYQESIGTALRSLPGLEDSGILTARETASLIHGTMRELKAQKIIDQRPRQTSNQHSGKYLGALIGAGIVLAAATLYHSLAPEEKMREQEISLEQLGEVQYVR